MYECFHCGHRSVIWDSDFSLEGEGIVNCCHCTHCGARIMYYVSLDPEEIEEITGRTSNE